MKVTSSSSIKQVVQIQMLKAQNDAEKAGVQKLYDSIKRVSPARMDQYIPTKRG